MTNAEKMNQMIEEAERYQAEIVSYEAAALKEIRAQRGAGTLQGGPTSQELDDIYHVAGRLDSNFWYQRAIGHRNSRVARATMYGIAALLDQNERTT